MLLDNLLNLLTIAAWAAFVLFIALAAVRAFQVGGAREAGKVLTSRRAVLGFIVALALSLLAYSLVFIEPQQVGVVVSVLSRDGYREQPYRSGLHWIVPMAEEVKRYPISWQTYTMATEVMEGAKVGNDSIAARTSDGQAVFLDSSVIFRIDPNEVIRLHIDFQNRYVEDFIRPVMRGIVRTEVSQFTADEVNSSKRKLLEANLEELLREAFSDKGFVLDRFVLRNIAFSEQYASAIEAKQVAEQQRIQREYQAEQVRTLAQGERDRLSLEAAGKASAITQQGEAEANVILVKAKAQAEALRLIAEALKKDKDLLTFQYIEKLAPGIKVMLVPNNNPFLLPLPDLTAFETGNPMLEATPTITETLSIPEPSTPNPTPTPRP